MKIEIVPHVLDFIRRRRRSYLTAWNADLRAVLVDLATFCRAEASTWGPTDRDTYRLIGRREVWLRLCHHLRLSEDELVALYGALTSEQRFHLFNPNAE